MDTDQKVPERGTRLGGVGRNAAAWASVSRGWARSVNGGQRANTTTNVTAAITDADCHFFIIFRVLLLCESLGMETARA